MTSVLIADDHALIRESFRALLEVSHGFTVAGEAATGVEAVRLVRELRPDVVLMDIRMPEMDGIEATRQICAESPSRVLILTTFDLDEYVYGALRAGASGFLVKDTTSADLLTGIRMVASGEALPASRSARRLIARFAQENGSRLKAVTEREKEVLTLIAQGMTNTEIAQKLFVTMGTVKTHISRLLKKLDARDRAQLVIIAYETGVVTPRR